MENCLNWEFYGPDVCHYRFKNTITNVNVTLQISKFTASYYILKSIIWKLFFFFFFFWDSPKCDVTIYKLQNLIILILKVGKLGWIEYIDKGVFTALTYLGFHHESKANKNIQIFCFSARALSCWMIIQNKSTQSKFANEIIVSR